MAVGNLPEININTSDIYNSIWNSIPREFLDKINLLFNIGKIIAILIIVYFALLIIGKISVFIFGNRESRILKKISRQLEEILELMKRGRFKKHK